MDRRTFLAGLACGTALVGAGALIIQPMPYPNTAPSFTISGDGTWTWFSDPRAVNVAGSPVVAAVTSAGRIGIYDANGDFTDLRGSLFQVDDHAVPALLVRSSDSKVLAFASAHNGSAIYTYLSTNANDVSAFGAETSIDASLGLDLYSYVNPIQLTDETNDPIYLFFRADNAGTRQYYYSTSTDQGSTWAAATQLLVNNGDSASHSPYVKMAQNGNDRIDFFCTDGHPQHSASNSIYHFYYEGGNFKKTDGTNLALPITPATHLSKVYDGGTVNAWIWDCAIDGSGNPVCVFASFPSVMDHRYHRGSWNGSSWDVEEICGAGRYLYEGEFNYSGGVAIDPYHTDVVFASVEIDGTRNLVRFEKSGSAWTPEQVTTDFAFRPFFVRGRTVEPRLAYLAGSYTSYTNYNTDIILTDSRSKLAIASGQRVPAGDMQSGSDFRIPAGDMDSGGDLRDFEETT